LNGDLRFDVVDLEGPKQYFGTLSRETIAHAYLFSGPAGVGKKTFARRLAQSLLCQRSTKAVLGYDGTCPSCALFAADGARHPDFVDFAGALYIGAADASRSFYDGEDLTSREIVRLFSMQSYVGGMRVLLLGDVEFASPSAANALLKFLEESPGGVVTILTTPLPGSLLPTLASRLIEVRFPLLSRAALADVLRRLGHGEAEARRGASLGGGSVARAIAGLDRQEDSLRANVARWFLESVEGRASERSWATRETLDEGLETIKALVRDWILTEQAGCTAVARLAEDYADALRALPPLGPARAVELLAKLDDAERFARTNVSAAMVAEFVRMALARGGNRDVTKSA
jgi:DNA polymerase-3 subunit delta'